ncbi:MAG TPA: DUF971 domain-containing protein [Ignavibacteria bacterium]|nr:DUF971 domain-containing protein [Ignavibacteria bacterium]
MNKPKKIRKTENNLLQIIWSDDSLSEIDLQTLRDKCPCVSCQGETVLFSSYIPIKSPFKAAGFYEIEKIETVGNYAVQITWKDKHNTGIYSWEYLKELSDLKAKS